MRLLLAVCESRLIETGNAALEPPGESRRATFGRSDSKRWLAASPRPIELNGVQNGSRVNQLLSWGVHSDSCGEIAPVWKRKGR